MMKEVYFQWLTKSDPNVSVAALALANVLQVASTKLAVFSKSLLLNVSIAVHVLVLVLQAQSKLNNLQHKKVSLHSLFLFVLFQPPRTVDELIFEIIHSARQFKQSALPTLFTAHHTRLLTAISLNEKPMSNSFAPCLHVPFFPAAITV